MKYILYPIWIVIVSIGVLFDIFIYLFINISILLWEFKFKKYTWAEYTETDLMFGTGYDKNIKETFLRRLNFDDYKNSK